MKVRLPFLLPGLILLALGLLWVLQGADVLGGSFMSGQKLWLGIGIVVAAVGAALAFWGLSARARRT